MKIKIFLFLILVLSLFLRVYNLDKNPPGFFCDEASIGYSAYSILKTGRDEYGYHFPLFFKAFGEYKSPVMIYSAVPFIALFGLSEFSVRLVAAFYGVLTVGVIFLLTRKLFNKDVAILASLFLAVSPWHVHLSRVGFEMTPAVFFTTLTTYLFLISLQSSRFLILSFFSFALALYSYFSMRIFIPLFMLGVCLIFWRFLFKNYKVFFIALIFFVFLSLPLVIHSLKGEGLIHWYQLSIFRNKSFLSAVKQTQANYFSHFSLNFLFKKGDIDFPGQTVIRHSVRGVGQLYWFQLPLLLVSLIFSWFKNDRKKTLLLFLWLLVFPVAGSLTVDENPQATRSVVGVVPLTILSAFGAWFLFRAIGKISAIILKKFLYLVAGIGFVLIVVFSVFDFADKLFNRYPLYAAAYQGWQYGPREIIEYFLEVEEKYDELVLSGDFNSPYIFLKFYAPNRCKKCLIGNLDKLRKEQHQLFALKPEEVPKDFAYLVKKRIFYPNGELVFLIVEPK